MRNFTAILFFVLVLGTMPWPTASGAADILPLRPTAELASGIRQGAGTVAWSPDGQYIAYLSGRLTIMNASSAGQDMKSPVKGVYFIRWIDAGSLLALRRDGDVAYAARLDAQGVPMDEIALPLVPDAAYPLDGFGQLLLVRDTSQNMKIGVRTSSTLTVMDTSTAEHREAYKAERIHPRGLKGTGFIMGWAGAGPSPLDHSMLLINYKDPPALNPYSKATVVDYLTGMKDDIYRSPTTRLLPGASWSPKGDRIAVPGRDGSLRLMGRDGITMTLDEVVNGAHAAWSPAGSRLCFGGVLMYTDGSARRKLVDSGKGSRCFWAPRGRNVAVLSKGTLRMYRDPMDRGLKKGALRPGYYSASKVKVLRDLFQEGLIDLREYSKRFRKIMGYPENVR